MCKLQLIKTYFSSFELTLPLTSSNLILQRCGFCLLSLGFSFSTTKCWRRGRICSKNRKPQIKLEKSCLEKNVERSLKGIHTSIHLWQAATPKSWHQQTMKCSKTRHMWFTNHTCTKRGERAKGRKIYEAPHACGDSKFYCLACEYKCKE